MLSPKSTTGQLLLPTLATLAKALGQGQPAVPEGACPMPRGQRGQKPWGNPAPKPSRHPANNSTRITVQIWERTAAQLFTVCLTNYYIR